MKIVLDAMGGDRVPLVPVLGALEALDQLDKDIEIILVGNENLILRELKKKSLTGSRLSIIHSSEVVGMDESPSVAIRKKKDSSISVGIKLQREGKADAFISAGNTGAVMAQAMMDLGKLRGITRPGIVQNFPTKSLPCAVLDVGANVECKPVHLFHFALMGAIYVEDVFDRPNPRVGLLNIGEEPTKGNELSVGAYELLKMSELNFVGNLEGRDILEGKADVVVCDGFVGNVVLKFSESIIDLIMFMIRSEVKKSLSSRVGALLMKPAFRGLQKVLDYAEYGGAPLLGIDGGVIICHGGSSPKAIRNAIRMARLAIIHDLNEHISQNLNQLPEEFVN